MTNFKCSVQQCWVYSHYCDSNLFLTLVSKYSLWVSAVSAVFLTKSSESSQKWKFKFIPVRIEQLFHWWESVSPGTLFHSSCPNHMECARFVSTISIFIFIVEGTLRGFKYTLTQKQKNLSPPVRRFLKSGSIYVYQLVIDVLSIKFASPFK